MFRDDDIAVLIVDGNADAATMLSRIATGLNFQVYVATTATEAMRLIEHADIMLIDPDMGDSGKGSIVLDEWLTRKPGPACVITANLDRDKEIDLIVRGVHNVIHKPIPASAIQALLNRYGRRIMDARTVAMLLKEIQALHEEVGALRTCVDRQRRIAYALLVVIVLLAMTALGTDGVAFLKTVLDFIL